MLIKRLASSFVEDFRLNILYQNYACNGNNLCQAKTAMSYFELFFGTLKFFINLSVSFFKNLISFELFWKFH